MPYNLLILPLLGGYILVTYTNCAVYWSSRQAREQLLLASAFVGLLLAAVARLIVLIVLECPGGLAVGNFVHRALELKGVGTAALSFALGIVGAMWLNRAWPMFQSALWLYGRGSLTQLESLMMMSVHAVRPAAGARFRSMPIEVMRRLARSIPGIRKLAMSQLEDEGLFEAIEQPDESGALGPIPLLLTMKDRKVYVGVLEDTPSFTASAFTHINLVVLRSGYRDKDTLRVSFTEDYTQAFQSVTTDLPAYKVIPVAEISSACLFDRAIFNAFQPFAAPTA